MTEPAGQDELLQRYSEANADDAARPGAHVRAAVRAHAEMMLAAGAQSASGDTATQPAANQSRWKISMLASIALAGITGLLVLQFDRGTPEEKDAAFGQPRAGTQVAPASPAEAEKPKAVEAAAAPTTSAGPSALPEKPAAKTSPPQAASKDMAKAAPAANDAAPAAFPASPPLAAATAPAPPAAPAAPAETARAYGRLSDAAEARTANAGAAPAPAPVPAPAPAIQSAPAAASRGPALLQQRSGEPAQASKARTEAAPQASVTSALQEAARYGRITDIEKLVRDGAPINAADSAGRTPLMNAVISGQTASVQRLLALGANTSLVDNRGMTALGHARKLGLDGIAAMLEARN